MALADVFLQQAMTPQNTGYMNAFNQGQQQAYGRGLSGAMASGAPRAEVLNKLAYVDPMQAGREMGMFQATGARGPTDLDKKLDALAGAEEIGQQAVAKSNEIIALLNQDSNADVSALYQELSELKQSYFTKTTKELKLPVFDLVEQKLKQATNRRAESKESRDVTGLKQKTIKDFRKEWSGAIDIFKVIPKIRSFAKEAKNGSQVGVQNLLKTISRMGSNEALSDSERDALALGDVGSKLDAFLNRFLGTGTSMSKNDVQSLLNMVDTMVPALMNQVNTVYKGLVMLRQEVRQLRRLMLK